MSNDKAAIAAWAARKKQRKLEQRARTKTLQAKVNVAKHPSLDWSSPTVEGVPEVRAPVETFNKQHQTMPVVKGLSFDAAKQMYRCRAYKNSRQINLYWGRSLAKALEALAEYRATEQ